MSEGMRSGVNCTRLASRPKHLAERLDQQRLGEARDADQQGVAAREDGDQRALDHDVLAEDDGGGGLMGALHPLGRGFEPGDDVGVSLG